MNPGYTQTAGQQSPTQQRIGPQERRLLMRDPEFMDPSWVRECRALDRIARVLRVELDWHATDAELFEKLADAAEELLTDAIIRDRL